MPSLLTGSRLYPDGSAGHPPPRRPLRRTVRLPFALAGAAAALIGLSSASLSLLPRAALPAPPSEIPVPVLPADQPVRVDSHVMARNERIYDALLSSAFKPEEVWALVTAARPLTNLSRVRSGAKFSVWRSTDPFSDGRVLSFQMALSANKTLLAREDGAGQFSAEVREIPYEVKLTGYAGTVTTSLWESAISAGMDPNLVAELADVFEFDLDFHHEIRSGDRYRLVVEQKFLDGRPAGYGRILAAQFVNRGEDHSAFSFVNAGGELDYYGEDGRSLKRRFLRSPLQYRRISSRFSSNRLHPILHTMRAHQGVDYAADPGTPVRAVADGLVEMARENGGCGNMVKLRHDTDYETAYCHLRGFAAEVREGARVRQGQVIGYVGQTGLATGPHLHFALYQNGVYVDPLSKRFRPADPIPASERSAFEGAKAKLAPLLPLWPDTVAQAKGPHPAAIAP